MLNGSGGSALSEISKSLDRAELFEELGGEGAILTGGRTVGLGGNAGTGGGTGCGGCAIGNLGTAMGTDNRIWAGAASCC